MNWPRIGRFAWSLTKDLALTVTMPVWLPAAIVLLALLRAGMALLAVWERTP
jgi:hypothetical protein